MPPTDVREPLAIVRQSPAGLRITLSPQPDPFGYGPRAKRSRSATRAGLVGNGFETVHNAIAPMWQPGAYIRSRELGGVVEGAHGHVARKAKGWLEYEIRHAAETREA
jgi:hypothetical protein